MMYRHNMVYTFCTWHHYIRGRYITKHEKEAIWQIRIRTDVLLKDFWRVNGRFEDLFNAVIFQGKEVLKAEELQEMDTDMSGVIRFSEHEVTHLCGCVMW